MQVTRIELDNIKSYESGSFDLEPGITAICGPNGSGKTTLLEAVSWALFDQLPYKKEDFLRRGAKKGSVKVTFISSLDGRQYTVYRDTGAGYYIYDSVTKMRLVEQKGQVAGWIKQHLGVDPSVDLKSLFTSAIGVPQGTFALDFAEQPSKRKIEFDKVLRVDEYQRCSDDLLPLVRFVETKLADLREQIARNEVRVAVLADLTAERRRLEAVLEQLKLDLPVLEGQRERARQELEHLDLLGRQIEVLTADKSGLSSRILESEKRLIAVGDEVADAKSAVAAVDSSASGFAAFNDASRRLSHLESESAARDLIRIEVAQKERQHIRLQAGLENLRERLNELLRDKDSLAALRLVIERQVLLEARRRDLQVAAGEMASLQEMLAATDRELDRLRAEYRDASRRVEESQKLKVLADKTPALEGERRKVEAELRGKQIELSRLVERKAEIARVMEGIASLDAEIRTLEKTIESAGRQQDLNESVAALEDEERRTTEAIATIRAELDLDERTLAQIKGGLCPLLAQRCLNMGEGETLDTYFRGRADLDRDRLNVLQSRREALQQSLAAARAAVATEATVETLRAQLARYGQDLERQSAQAAKLERETAGLRVSPDQVRQLSDRLTATDRELGAAHQAKATFEAALTLKQRLNSVQTEGAQKRDLRQDLEKRLASRATTQDELIAVEREIEALEDPRGRARLLETRISKEADLRLALQQAEIEERVLDEAMRILEKQLEAFASLDDRLIAERERRAASEKDYRTYIENQPIAALLPAREEEFVDLAQASDCDRRRLITITEELEAACSGYDKERHAQAKAALDDAINRASSAAFEQASLRERVVTLSSEIAELTEAKQKLVDLVAEKTRCESILSVSELTRDLLKKAAPFITEALLQSISIEANQLYRDIAGNPLVTLRWDSGYEVVLEEGGYDRPFANLSGGEQMAAALAIRLALLKELSDVRMAFFDEPTTNMDEERRRNLAEQIGRIKDFDQLFVISHDESFEGFTDRIIVLGGAGTGA
jgi:DNA repair protein SbcC/Rad50